MPADPVLAKVRNAESPTAIELRDGIASLRRSLVVLSSSRRLIDLGTLEFLSSHEITGDDAARRILIDAAEGHLAQGLAINPLDGLAWYRLAQVRQARDVNDGRAIVVALMQSLDMSPNLRSLWVARTFGLLVYRRYLTPEEMTALMSSLHTSWGAEKAFRIFLVRALRSNADALALLEQALANDTNALQQLRQLETQ